MTDPYSTPQRRNPENPGDAVPGIPVPSKSEAFSPVTGPIPAVNSVPPARQATPHEAPGQEYSARHSSDSDSSGRADQAKSAAQDVAGDAKDAGRAFKDTAAEEAAGVKDDAVREAKRLSGEASSMLQSQASDQLDRAAETVRTFSDDIGKMARGEKPEPGHAKDLADQLGSRADATATWLENHDPKDALDEVQRFARRRPVAFLAIAAGVGFAAGRLTRGIQKNHTDGDDQKASSPDSSAQKSASTSSTSAPSTTGAQSAPAPVSGTPGAGAPAYETGPGGPTPGYTGVTDPYAGGGGR